MAETQESGQSFRSAQLEALALAVAALRSGDTTAAESLRRMARALAASPHPEVAEAARRLAGASDAEQEEAAQRLAAVLAASASPDVPPVVLVVDDDPLTGRMLERRLAAPGRRVVVVPDRAQAEEVLAAEPVALILLDLFLPDADGRSILVELRTRPETAGIPVYVMSASGNGLARAESLALGADVYLQKPFDVDSLAAMVAAALNARRPQPLTPPEGAPGRPAAIAHFAQLALEPGPRAVACLLPETHGPGGTSRPDGSPAVTGRLVEAVCAATGDASVVARWSHSELVVVAPLTVEELAEAVDRVRLRVRNLPHPLTEGAMVSFSGGVVDASRVRSLPEAYGEARIRADRARGRGGDRVVAVRPRIGEHRRVLLAEDDGVAAALIMHRLQREGYEVVHHSDGSAALEAALRHPFTLAILDVDMPGLDGFQVLAHIRREPGLEGMPVVMLTALGHESDVVRSLDLGADDYVLKPFSPEELMARLRRLVES